MKLVRFQHGDRIRIGQVHDDLVVSLATLDDLSALIGNWERHAAKGTLDEPTPGSGLKVEDLALLAPASPPRNVICVGWNYLKHFNESIGKREGQEVDLPDHPTFFSKLPTTIAGPNDALPLHQAYTAKLDWEVELAVVIGKGGRDIKEKDALKHVFGYTVANDISARDLQRAHGGQWFKGKSLDLTCPLGPVLVTADELGDPQNLEITCHVNGKLMQSGHTGRQIFTVARVIAELSAGLTLLPGDLILTGTPEGIGAARTPPIFLKDGDIVECGIEKIGVLRNLMQSTL
ncbi:fumarylacetoacetate hydrolase family protein [Pollutimonas sp. H1-120]|uniref:fumarylacetoacetate hydrolase family protein n=1 Tax=Pollutimonas sp. H1-120 TaxID=3148824 RepID=UPI003B515CEC